MPRFTTSLENRPRKVVEMRAPRAVIENTILTVDETGTVSLIVDYFDPTGIDLDAITGCQLAFERQDQPQSGALQVQSMSTQFAGAVPRSVRVTYSIDASGNKITRADFGSYRVLQHAGEQSDLQNIENPARVLGVIDISDSQD